MELHPDYFPRDRVRHGRLRVLGPPESWELREGGEKYPESADRAPAWELSAGPVPVRGGGQTEAVLYRHQVRADQHQHISLTVMFRYRCDSRMDCPAGDDESPVFCGPEPCKGKIVCPELDFRCIDPTEYCCDPQTGE